MAILPIYGNLRITEQIDCGDREIAATKNMTEGGRWPPSRVEKRKFFFFLKFVWPLFYVHSQGWQGVNLSIFITSEYPIIPAHPRASTLQGNQIRRTMPPDFFTISSGNSRMRQMRDERDKDGRDNRNGDERCERLMTVNTARPHQNVKIKWQAPYRCT